MEIGYGCQVPKDNIVIKDPDHDWFRDFLKEYYIVTKDYQYLFGSTQAGRRGGSARRSRSRRRSRPARAASGVRRSRPARGSRPASP